MHRASGRSARSASKKRRLWMGTNDTTTRGGAFR